MKIKVIKETMRIYQINELPSVQWKDCRKCWGTGTFHREGLKYPCENCKGSGKEPVAVENPIDIDRPIEEKMKTTHKTNIRKLQLGKVFEVDEIIELNSKIFPLGSQSKSFLVKSCLKENDMSVVMVVPK